MAELSINADQIAEALRKHVGGFSATLEKARVGRVLEVGDGIARVSGLPETAVKESVHRIERALANLGYQRPSGRTIINLAPADLPKAAGAFDLPVALGMLVSTGQLLPEQLKDFATASATEMSISRRRCRVHVAPSLLSRRSALGISSRQPGTC